MWRDVHGDASKLHCVICISGTMLHLEAIHVRERGGVQEAVNLELADDFSSVCRFGNEGPFETTEIDGKRYVLVATPFT